MIGDIEDVLQSEPKFIIKDGVIRGEEISYRKDENNFGTVLLTGMRENAKFVGQVDSETGREDTFGDMALRTVKCGLWLLSQGVKSGDVVAICTHNHLDSPIPVLACLCIGAVFNPWWDHGLTTEMAKHFMTLTRPKVIFTTQNYAKLISDIANELKLTLKIVVFENNSHFQTFNDIMEKYKLTDVENFECRKLSSMKEAAYIEYTSGSTGLPKGALHPHESLFGNIMNTGSFSGRHNIALCYSNLCWITGLICTLYSIAYFHTRIIVKLFTPENLCQVVEKYKVTWILTGTSAVNRLLKSKAIHSYNLSSLKSIWIGGAVLKEETQIALRQALLGTHVMQIYGSTESGGASVHQTRVTKANSIGTVARGYDLKIIHPESEEILSANQKGEICVRSPFIMIEYYRNPEKTKETIKSDGFIHTGDLGYYDDDGAVYIIDRLKELIKWRGHHVSPSIVEQVILSYPGVAETAVIGVPDWEDDERPMAFLTTVPNAQNMIKDEIKKLVEEKLPEQMWLRGGVEIMDELPHTASGKIARNELKKMAEKFIRDS